MLKPKIVFFDIDDTIYRKYTDTLRPSVPEAMRALKERGILTAIATGRAPVAIPEKIRREVIEGAQMDLLVTINGQYIDYRGATLNHQPLDTDTIADLCAFFDDLGISYAFVSNNDIAVSEKTPEAVAAMANILPNHIVDKEFYRKAPVYQMLVFYPPERDVEVAAKVAEIGYQAVRWHEQAVDLLNSEGSKARGIAVAIEALGIEMKDVMAFGDGLNDLEMLKTVGFGVAMENGHEQAKAVAQYVCPSVEQDGVLNGLKALGVIES